jgi:hypothetical protein
MAAKTARLLLLSLITGLTLSACSGGSSETTESYGSVEALAKALGCGGVAPDKRASGVKEQGHCKLDGERMTVYIWPDGVASKEPGGASPFGGGWVVLGKNWTVTAVTADGAKKIRDTLGGQLK